MAAKRLSPSRNRLVDKLVLAMKEEESFAKEALGLEKIDWHKIETDLMAMASDDYLLHAFDEPQQHLVLLLRVSNKGSGKASGKKEIARVQLDTLHVRLASC